MASKYLILLLLLTVVCVAGCGEADGPQSTETSSTKFSTLSEKVEFLEQYVKFRRTYEDMDFVIYYRNGSEGRLDTPAPSEWDIRIIAKVPSAELSQWTKGLSPTTSPEVDWLGDLPGRIDHSGVSVWFQSDRRLVGVDEDNAIIVYRNMAM
jgi:hypothetical protein